PGNVPAFIERTANYKKAVADIVYGTTFDNGTLCSSEQSMIVDLPLKEKVTAEAVLQGCYFVNAEEKEKLSRAIQTNLRINPEIVGKSATFIANFAGFEVPENTKVLIAECNEVGKNEPLSIEKLSPVLSLYIVDGWLEGCHRCIDLLQFGGMGHTMAIHSNDEPIIMKFALEKPAFRILVNTPASVGAVGYTTALDPSMTLGPGTWGGSIVSDNVTAKHLLNIKSLAFETNPVNKGKSIDKFETQKYKGGKDWFLKEIEERLRDRAGNLPLKDKYTYSKKETKTEEKTEPLKPISYGSGITEEEIKKIVKEFSSKEF
ncbi:MAG: acetaldehyde dehydrogenase, partial [Chlorobium sp.]|nr:acetaldehyde dehydrogenase [Chlorobium sp.]